MISNKKMMAISDEDAERIAKDEALASCIEKVSLKIEQIKIQKPKITTLIPSDQGGN